MSYFMKAGWERDLIKNAEHLAWEVWQLYKPAAVPAAAPVPSTSTTVSGLIIRCIDC
jgi:hypothetical protein